MSFANLLLSYDDVRTPLFLLLLLRRRCKLGSYASVPANGTTPHSVRIMDSSQKKEGRFDNLQVIFVGHGSATGVPWCVAPETFHPASKVVLVASRPVNIQTGTHKG